MPNPGRPTVQYGDKGDAVFQSQRALRRTPNIGLAVDGEFGPETEAATKEFQQQAGLPVTGVVDEATWASLPSGHPMPVLQKGSSGKAVWALQQILTMGAPGLWGVTPKGVDGEFGSNTEQAVRALQAWARIGVDGIVGAQTWSVALLLEFAVGIEHALGVQPVEAS